MAWLFYTSSCCMGQSLYKKVYTNYFFIVMWRDKSKWQKIVEIFPKKKEIKSEFLQSCKTYSTLIVWLIFVLNTSLLIDSIPFQNRLSLPQTSLNPYAFTDTAVKCQILTIFSNLQLSCSPFSLFCLVLFLFLAYFGFLHFLFPFQR